MKVLILSTFEHSGGAAIAAGRLMQALNRNGIEATMLCRRNITWGPKVLRKQSWSSIWERIVIAVGNGFTLKDLWAMDIANCGQDVMKTKEYREADIIHLHWINQGFISLDTIGKMLHDGKKVVWTMHDAWNSMGAYHLKIQRKGSTLEKKTWLRKQSLYADHNIRFVACSRWLRDEVLASKLMHDQNVVAIPNPIDTDFFKPAPHANKRRVLFVAQNVNNPMKGIQYLNEAREMLDGVEILALGRDIPYISSPREMADLYAGMDAFVLPSLSENLPNTIMEAMSCGTPCVGFNVGGIPEMIDHKTNGYVARYKDAKDLAAGISYVLDETNHSRLAADARQKVINCYGEKAVAEMYKRVYKN